MGSHTAKHPAANTGHAPSTHSVPLVESFAVDQNVGTCLVQAFGRDGANRIIASVTWSAARAGDTHDYTEMGFLNGIVQVLQASVNTNVIGGRTQQGNAIGESPPGMVANNRALAVSA